MKALAYHGPGQRSWDTVADPKPTEPTDIVVRIDTITICGTDLHILKGDDPTVEQGRVLGHEAGGTVVEVGNAVTSLRADDRVLVPAITPRRPCHGYACGSTLPHPRTGGRSHRRPRTGSADAPARRCAGHRLGGPSRMGSRAGTSECRASRAPSADAPQNWSVISLSP